MSLVFAHEGTLYLVLDEENVDRIQQHDPYDFNQHTAGVPLSLRFPLRIVVAYARKDEQAKIAAMGSNAELVQYLRRGYHETASDHERVFPIRPLKES
jgi:hypothetical protein